jgi:hypothetical protein
MSRRWNALIMVPFVAMLVATALAAAPARATAPSFIHLMPVSRPLRAAGPVTPAITASLTYQGGRVMQAGTQVVPIFWQPAHLQDGSTATVDGSYNALIQRFTQDFGGHGLYNNLTQYYQVVGHREYIVNASGFLQAIVDTSAYPAAAGGCSANSFTNCITDAQLQNEILTQITAASLPKGFGTFYPVFTDPGELSCMFGSSCFDPDLSFPSIWQYCAYHGSFSAGGTVVYANMPYLDTNTASIAGCAGGAPDPNSDSAFDDETSAFSHEFNESITDPQGDAWYDQHSGNEVADICNQDFVRDTWGGHPYTVQKEWSVATGSCVAGGGDEIALSPAAGPAGSRTRVTGSHFKPNTTVTFSFSATNGTVHSLGTTTSNGAGAIAKTVNIPAGAANGLGILDATGANPGDGASAAFTTSGTPSIYRPDALIGGAKTGPFRGNGVYNLTGTSQTFARAVTPGTTSTFWIEVQNDGNLTDTFSLKGPAAPAGFTVTYKVGTTGETAAVEGGAYRQLLGSHASFLLQVIVGVKTTTSAGTTFAPKVTVASRGNVTKKDVVLASARAQ